MRSIVYNYISYQISKMPFKKIKARAKNCRGAGDEFVIAQFEENYSTWQGQVAGLSDAEKSEVGDAFNKIHEGLGDALLDDKEMFLMTKGDLNPDLTKKFCALLTSEYFELEE